MQIQTPHMLILPPRFSEDSIALRRAALEAGWQVERLQSWAASDAIAHWDGKYVFHGEVLLAAALVEQIGLALLAPPDDWLPSLPDQYLMRKVRRTTLGAAKECSGRVFAKPAFDKSFEARVYANGSELVDGSCLSADAPVIVAEPVEFTFEARCFVAHRQVVTISPYWRDGQLAKTKSGDWPFFGSEEEEARALAQQLLADPAVAVPPGFVLDVGYIRDRGWAVVEANAAWGSGLYGCSPHDALQSIAASCCRKGENDAEHWAVRFGEVD